MSNLDAIKFLETLTYKNRDPEKEKTYYEALGRFIASYAVAEASLHVLARHFSGTTDEKARVIFGGMRLADLTDRIRQMVRHDVAMQGIIADQRIYTRIDDCLTQLNKIADKRGELVHRTISYIEDGFAVSNTSTAKSLMGIERKIITHTDLKNMRFDCNMIFLRLDSLAPDSPVANAFLQPSGDDDDLWQTTWRYISAPPNPQKPKHQKAQKERRRQRSA